MSPVEMLPTMYDLPSGAIIVWALVVTALLLKFIYRSRVFFRGQPPKTKSEQ